MPQETSKSVPTLPKSALHTRHIRLDWVMNNFGIAPVLIILCIVLGGFNSAFWSWENWSNLLVNIAPLWIMAMGMTFVLLSGGFDLSVGSTMALSGVVLLFLLQSGLPQVLAILLTIVIGGLIGALSNGLLIGRFRLNFFVITLGTMSLFQGAVYVITNGNTEYTTRFPLVQQLGVGAVIGVPLPIIVMAITFLGALFVLQYTTYGRTIYVTGGSLEAARICGVPVNLVLVSVYGICGALASLAGVIQTGQLASVSPTVGLNSALLVGAAVLLGGTTFRGGEGGVIGTAFGAIFIGVLQNGLDLSGISSFWQDVITGAILILAVVMNQMKYRILK